MTGAISFLPPDAQTNWSGWRKAIKFYFKDDFFSQECPLYSSINPCWCKGKHNLGFLCPLHTLNRIRSNFQDLFNSLYCFSSHFSVPVLDWWIHMHLVRAWFSFPLQFPHFLYNNVLCLINEGETALIDSISNGKLSWGIFMSCMLQIMFLNLKAISMVLPSAAIFTK